MKKILFASTLFLMTAASMSAQTYVKLYQGRAQDTIHKSTTLTSAAVNMIDASGIKTITMQVAADSVSGSPAPLFIIQRSVDGTHFESFAGDSLTCTVTDGVGTVAKTVAITPYNYPYARVLIKTSSSTQKSKVWVTVFATKAP